MSLTNAATTRRNDLDLARRGRGRYLGGALDPIPHVVDDGLSGGSSAGELPGGDDGATSVLHGGDELALQPGVIRHGTAHLRLLAASCDKHRASKKATSLLPRTRQRCMRDSKRKRGCTRRARDVGVVDVGVLGLGVVAPDDHVVDLVDVDVQALGDLALGPVVVQAGETAEVLLGQAGSGQSGDQCVGVGRVADDQNLL